MITRMHSSKVDYGKPWYASRTIYFNVLAVAFGVCRMFGMEIPVSDEAVDALAVALAAVGNVVLRFMTDRPLVSRVG